MTNLRARIAAAKPRGVVLSLQVTPDVDGTSIEALTDFCAEQARAGVALMLARLKDPALALLEVSAQSMGNTMLEPGSVDDAVGRLLRNAPAGLTPNLRIQSSEPENVAAPPKG